MDKHLTEWANKNFNLLAWQQEQLNKILGNDDPDTL